MNLSDQSSSILNIRYTLRVLLIRNSNYFDIFIESRVNRAYSVSVSSEFLIRLSVPQLFISFANPPVALVFLTVLILDFVLPFVRQAVVEFAAFSLFLPFSYCIFFFFLAVPRTHMVFRRQFLYRQHSSSFLSSSRSFFVFSVAPIAFFFTHKQSSCNFQINYRSRNSSPCCKLNKTIVFSIIRSADYFFVVFPSSSHLIV